MINFKKFINKKDISETYLNSLDDRDFLFSLEYYVKNLKKYNKNNTDLFLERYMSIDFSFLEFKNSFGAFLIKNDHEFGFNSILDLCFSENIHGQEIIDLSLSFLSEAIVNGKKKYSSLIFEKIKYSFDLKDILYKISFCEENLDSIKMMHFVLNEVNEYDSEEYRFYLKENFQLIASPYKRNFKIIDALLNLIKDYHQDMLISRYSNLYKQCLNFVRLEKRNNFIKVCA